MTDYPFDEMKEIVDDFLVETDEIIASLDTDIVTLENNPSDNELLNRIFRSVHTIKGAAGFLGFNHMVEVVHKTETILNKLRQGEMIITPQINDVILLAIDVIKSLMNDIREDKKGATDIQSVVILLDKIIAKETVTASEDLKPVNETVLSDKKLGEILIDNKVVSMEQVQDALEAQDPPKIGEVLVNKKFATKEQIKKALSAQPKATAKVEQAIRVDVSRLDNVMDLVGELVLSRNRLLQLSQDFAEKYEDEEMINVFNEISAHVNLVTTDLQSGVMKTRVQPIGRVFNKFPRMVRDIARELHKEVDFIIKGEETELDRSIIEVISDPLMHIIRNSLDHGLENAEDRVASGKSPRGILELSAYYEGNNIVIEIRDDGRGIDIDLVVEKAIDNGLIKNDDYERMDEKDIINLIFTPGFSTAKSVTDVSGRGVGMDVVKSNITKLNGIIDISTEKGVGTDISIRLPLTVAIIQTLMVGISNEIFAIPLNSVVEILRISTTDIYHVKANEVIKLRDRILPLVRMSTLFNVQTNGHSMKWFYVVVVGIAEKKIGIIVEKLHTQEEVVIKSIGEYVHTKGIAGATILGNGKVTLIVDIPQFMELVNEALSDLNTTAANKRQEIKTNDY